LQRDVIQATGAVAVSRKVTETIADTTWSPILFGAGDSVLHFWYPLGHERYDSKHKAFLRGHNQGDRSIGGSQAVTQKMLTASVAFVEALSTFLSGTEAWFLVCSINRRM
jgi:hypothetical protein